MRFLLIKTITYIFIYQLLVLAFPLLSGYLIDLLVTADKMKYNLFLIVLVLIPFTQGLLEWKKSRGTLLFSETYVASKRGKVIEALLNVSIQYFSTARTGEIITRTTDDIKEYADNLKLKFELIEQLFVFTIVSVIIAFKSLILLAVVLFCCFIYAIQSKYMAAYIKKVLKIIMHNTAEYNEFIRERIEILPLTRVTGKTDWEIEQLEKILEIEEYNSLRITRITFWNEILSNVIRSIVIGIVYCYLCWLIVQKKISLGDLISCIAYFYSLLEIFRSALEWIKRYKSHEISISRIEEVLSLDRDVNQIGSDFKEDVTSIQFENVTFGYPGKELILKEVSFSLKKGKVLALVGGSGGGKSTIAELLLKYYVPISGKIKINMQFDLSSLSGGKWREKINYSSQDSFFFTDTIKGNLLYGKHDDNQRVAYLAQSLNMEHILLSKELGYETIIKPGNTMFSGGQKQRLSLIRSLINSKPNILILDEPTSALDYISESAAMKLIFEQKQNTATLLIAHRLSTIKNADEILVLHEGRVIEQGTHDELFNLKGKYFEMYRHELQQTN